MSRTSSDVIFMRQSVSDPAQAGTWGAAAPLTATAATLRRRPAGS